MTLRMRFLSILLLPYMTSSTFSAKAGNVQADSLLLLLFDAGETFALKPVITQLALEGCNYRILAFGAAMTQLQGSAFVDRMIHLQLDCRMDINATTELRRNKALPIEQLKSLEMCLQQKLHTKVMVTGSVSTIQEQLTCRFLDKKLLRARRSLLMMILFFTDGIIASRKCSVVRMNTG